MVTTAERVAPLRVKDLKSGIKPIWCPGCGDYGILSSFFQAIINLKLDPAKVAVVSGIGCSGRFPAFARVYGFHGVHGRALPTATGLKVARPDLTVFAMSGDGDAFSIGGGHIAHAARRNVDITYIVMDNEIYGLTKGQPSATSPPDILELSLSGKTKGSRKGMVGLLDIHKVEEALNPILMALAYNASFVARAFSGRPKELTAIIEEGVRHKGFSFIQVMSPCVTFFNTYNHFRETVVPLPEDHDPSDRMRAMALAMEPNKTYVGIFYRDETRPSLEERLEEYRQQLSPTSMEELLARFTR